MLDYIGGTALNKLLSVLFSEINVGFSVGDLLAAILDYTIDRKYNNVVFKIKI